MSYTIMYDRQFIKTSRSIIPLVLCGENNVTEFSIYGREVRERKWDTFGGDQTEFTPKEYLDFVQGYCTGGDYQAHFQKDGKFVDDAGFLRWAKKGIETAMTLEEIIALNPLQKLKCTIFCKLPDPLSWEHESQFCTTTSALEEWLDAAYPRVEEWQQTYKHIAYISLSFYGREKLHKPHIQQKAVPNEEKPFCIRITTAQYPQGIFVVKLSSRKLFLDNRKERAMRFKTSKAAERYFDKLKDKCRAITTGEVVNLIL